MNCTCFARNTSALSVPLFHWARFAQLTRQALPSVSTRQSKPILKTIGAFGEVLESRRFRNAKLSTRKRRGWKADCLSTGLRGPRDGMPLSAPSCQVSVSMAMVDGRGGFTGAPASGTKLPDTTFGNVFSDKVAAQTGDCRSSHPPSARAAAETVSSKKAETAKEKSGNLKGDDSPPAHSFAVTDVLHKLPTDASDQCNPCLPNHDLKSACAVVAEAGKNRDEAAQVGTCGAPPAKPCDAAGLDKPGLELRTAAEDASYARVSMPTAVPSHEGQQSETAENATETDKRENVMATRLGNASCPPGGDAASSPVVVGLDSGLATAQRVADGTSADASAMPQGIWLPRPPAVGSAEASTLENTPATSQPPPDSAVSAGAATPALATLTELKNAPGTAGEASLPPVQQTIPPPNWAVARSSAASQRSSDGPSKTARKPDGGGAKPPQLSNVQRSDEPTRIVSGDSSGDKRPLAQPTPTVAALDGHGNPGTPTNAELPQAARSQTSVWNGREASAAPTSTPAENAASAPPVIQSARVLERMGQSEMRLGMNSSDFGSIELHAHVSLDRVGASIATSHTELRAAMMAEMPSLEHAIAQHQLKLDNFNLDPRTGAQNSDTGASAGNQSPRSRTQSADRASEFSDDTAPEMVPAQAWTTPRSSGLNVHA